jgi:quercetin dioxygenase-like cupin family protein
MPPYQLLATVGPEKPHSHDRHDLTVVLLRGTGVLVVDGHRHVVRAGDVMHVGRGRTHHFHPRGDQPALGLAMFTPRLEAPDYRSVDPP